MIPESYTLEFINHKKELFQYKAQILDLFTVCFGTPLNPVVWDWAYTENPCGASFTCLAFWNNELVGHYAGIPQEYANSTETIFFLLSMTTMVRPEHRGVALFKEMADLTYTEAQKAGINGVLGFPNKNSKPGFKKRLNWLVLEDNVINAFSLDQLLTLSPKYRLNISKISQEEFLSCYQLSQLQFTLNLKNKSLLNWRVNKPGVHYEFGKLGSDLFIFKGYQEGLDVVFCSATINHEILSALAAYAQENHYQSITIYSRDNQFQNIEPNQKTPYYFGYRMFDNQHYPLDINLIMSDVF